MAYSSELRRFSIVTGTLPDADVLGVAYGDGRVVYRKYQLAPNSYSTPITGAIADLTDLYSAMAGYTLTYIDPLDPDGVSVAPTGGTTAGGTAFVITGTGLNSATVAVTIGGAAATTVRWNSTTIAGVSPAGTAGAKDIVITTSEGTDTMTGAWTYS